MAVPILRRTKTSDKGDWRKAGPIIAPSAISAFLQRPLQDYSWMKKVSEHDLFNELIFPELFKKDGFGFHTKPFLHQLVCMMIGSMMPRFLFLLDMGAGKTKIILDMLYYRMLLGEVKHVLVLVPFPVNTEGWVEQIKEHRPELKCVQLLGNQDDRGKLIARDADIYLLNYDGLMVYMSHLRDGGRVIDRRMARDFASLFDTVVFDESHLLGNKKSLTFRMCDVLAKYCKYCYALTGTPFGRNPEKLWSQFYLVDRGDTLSTTLGLFRAVFFTGKDNYFGGVDYKFNPEREAELHRTIQHRSIRYKDVEFSDVPKIRRIPHRLSFAIDAEKYYQRVLEELRQSRGNFRELQSSYIRMRQVCGGFLSVRGEDEARIQVKFYTNPKLEELESMIDGLEVDQKMLIYHEYIVSGDMICDMLTRKNLKWVRAGAGTKDQVGGLRRFMENEKYRFVVANNNSGFGAGLNLQKVCRHITFYESPDNPSTRTQIEKRITGGLRTQGHFVYIHDLLIIKSVDIRIQKFLEEGKSLFEAIVEGKERL